LPLNLANPLTPPSPLRGEGHHDRRSCNFFLDTRPHYSYITILGDDPPLDGCSVTWYRFPDAKHGKSRHGPETVQANHADVRHSI
jgi:hypothetical protein